MTRLVLFTPTALSVVEAVRDLTEQGAYQSLKASLALLADNPDNVLLRPHRYRSVHGINGEDVWESFVIGDSEDDARRIFWHYGSSMDTIVVVSITPP